MNYRSKKKLKDRKKAVQKAAGTLRDSSDPKYKKWKMTVRERDDDKCQMCPSEENVDVHHIKRYADCAELRYDPNNGICLCKKCHKKVTGSEDNFAQMLMRLVIKRKRLNHEKEIPGSSGPTGES